jgi:histone deacetylase 1/2
MKYVAPFFFLQHGSLFFRPQRLRLTHELVLSFGLDRKMDMLKSRPASELELTRYHDPEYIHFLSKVAPQHSGSSGYGQDKKRKNNMEIDDLARKYNVGEQSDCPLFDGLFRFVQTTCGASIDAARRLNSEASEVCISWSGGLHHAKKTEASGFCYGNDIVLAILELLTKHQRVLYIDIDVHHGDGVEEAFYYTNRVMTCSFHKFGQDFFPGTGDLNDMGAEAGLGYTVNFPFKDGLEDLKFDFCFRPVIEKIMQTFNPGAIVLQCGADSLAGDRLGVFDLSLRGHAACVQFVKSFHKPLLVLGGGGYTNSTVARCWAFETSVLIGVDIPNEIPKPDPFYEYYAPSYTLHQLSLERTHRSTSSAGSVPVLRGSDLSGTGDKNTYEYLALCRDTILKRLDDVVRGSPSVSMLEVPPSWIMREEEELASKEAD